MPETTNGIAFVSYISECHISRIKSRKNTTSRFTFFPNKLGTNFTWAICEDIDLSYVFAIDSMSQESCKCLGSRVNGITGHWKEAS